MMPKCPVCKKDKDVKRQKGSVTFLCLHCDRIFVPKEDEE